MMTTPLDAALGRLRAADEAIHDLSAGPSSLRPGADRARSLVELVQTLGRGRDAELVAAFGVGLATIVEAQLEHFPETIFWDLDFMAAEILRGRDAPQIAALCRDIAALQAQYGRRSVLAFRYVHDFTYGYDWAKWVMQDPAQRGTVRPFDPAFIAYLKVRGAELVELIAHDDDKYPKLPDGRPRNPFGFSREPVHERALFEGLARRDLLPVQTWDVHAQPVADRPFAALREDLAAELHVPTRRQRTDG